MTKSRTAHLILKGWNGSIFFTNCGYYDKTDLFKKDRCKISIFSFVHSDWVWVDPKNVMKKSLLPPDTKSKKTQFCIGNMCMLHKKQKKNILVPNSY